MGLVLLHLPAGDGFGEPLGEASGLQFRERRRLGLGQDAGDEHRLASRLPSASNDSQLGLSCGAAGTGHLGMPGGAACLDEHDPGPEVEVRGLSASGSTPDRRMGSTMHGTAVSDAGAFASSRLGLGDGGLRDTGTWLAAGSSAALDVKGLPEPCAEVSDGASLAASSPAAEVGVGAPASAPAGVGASAVIDLALPSVLLAARPLLAPADVGASAGLELALTPELLAARPLLAPALLPGPLLPPTRAAAASGLRPRVGPVATAMLLLGTPTPVDTKKLLHVEAPEALPGCVGRRSSGEAARPWRDTGAGDEVTGGRSDVVAKGAVAASPGTAAA